MAAVSWLEVGELYFSTLLLPALVFREDKRFRCNLLISGLFAEIAASFLRSDLSGREKIKSLIAGPSQTEKGLSGSLAFFLARVCLSKSFFFSAKISLLQD